MDIELENKVKDAIEQLKRISPDDIDFQTLDPVVKMMLVALMNESQKIVDNIKNVGHLIEERYCTDFIPRQEIEAMPAIAIINPTFKPNKDADVIPIGADVQFTYKTNARKQPLNYIPVFNTSVFPYSQLYILTNNQLKCGDEVVQIDKGQPNTLWLGITTSVETDCLKGLTLLIKGTDGITPEHIYTGAEEKGLDFARMAEMEHIEMADPFDAQQASGQFYSFVESWKEYLQNIDNATLISITDDVKNRDLFKRRAFPHSFLKRIENDILKQLDPQTIWLRIVFPEDYVVPDECEVVLNVMPVVNVDVCSVTLNQANPIAKLQKQDDSFFLRVLETSTAANRQGFSMLDEEVVIRDFDVDCYNNGDLYRDVRNLYNHFVDDYYAFIEYNEIKDGEALRVLRETINKIGNNASVKDPNKSFKFNSGTYAMMNLRQKITKSTIKVNYLATQGQAGNAPREGEMMENKKLPVINQKVSVIVSAACGTNKATADERYELLRYYSLTNDRLYTKMDIAAFLRKEVMAEFGKEEFKRIFLKMNIEGAGGPTQLQRGLYIDIEFKDKKNYEKAVERQFDTLMRQRIENKSCIAMPIIVNLRNLEES